MKSNKRILQISLVCILIVTLTVGCNPFSPSVSKGMHKSPATFTPKPITNMTPELNQSVAGSNQLGYLLLKSFIKDDNVLISPVSLSFALAMLQNGAKGETQDGILKVMGESTGDGLNQRYKGLFSKLISPGDPTDEQSLTVLIGNSFWLREPLEAKQDFVDNLVEFYKGQVYQSDFKDPKTVDQINRWVEEQTNGLLKKTINEISDQTVAYLMNTVYFKGSWLKAYTVEATYDDPFSLLDGSSVQVPTMHQTNHFEYFESDTAQVAAFPYHGGMTMKVVLPKEAMGQLLNETTYETLQSWLNATAPINLELKVSIPKFEYDVKNSLSEFLETAGMDQSFDPSTADFSAMVEIQGENVFVSDIFQNCKITNDEKGTEAAAATVVQMGETSAQISEDVPIEFNCNKPFMYVIEDDITGAILFMGVVVRPSHD